MLNALRNLSFAARALARAPGHTIAAIVTLALGIGATTAIYSVVDATMLRPLPYGAPERLMDLSLTIADKGEGERPMVWSYPKFETMRTMQHSFAELAGYATQDVTLSGQGDAERVRVEVVSGSYFPLLKSRASRGRLLQPSDDNTASAAVAVLSHTLWMRRFGGDSAIVGRDVILAGQPFLVVGIAAPEFRALSGTVDAWAPMSRAPQLIFATALQEPWSHWMDAVGRLRDGVAPSAATTELRSLGQRIEEAHAGVGGPAVKWGATATPLREARSDPQLARAIVILFGAVCCVLLIACVNVANLLLARAARREREFAVRVAIGAKRAQVVGQLLRETLLLSVVGGLLGVALASWSLDALRLLTPGSFGGATTQAAQYLSFESVTLHGGVLAFALVVSLLTGVLCGVIPALRASRPNLTSSLKDGAGASSEGALSFRRGRARALLIAGDVAISLLLLIGAGLLVRSFAQARGVDGGFNPRNVLTFRIQPPDDSAFSGERAVRYKEEVLQRLAALPGAEVAAVNFCAPLSQACNRTIALGVDGVRGFPGGTEPELEFHAVSADYLRVIGARLEKGRFFTNADRTGAPKVVVINRAAAQRLFPNENAVGHRVSLAIGLFKDNEYGEIVGVVNDVNYGAVGDAPRPAAYISSLQTTSARGMYMIRTTGDPAALLPGVREAMRSINAGVPLYDEMTLEARAGQALGRLRFGAVLLGSFAVLGLVLTIVGIYGVLSYSVAQRTRELGIRQALGAGRGELISMVMRRAMTLASLGLAIGLGVAWGASRLLRGLVFGISPTDPATFAEIAVVVAAVCAVSSYLPARRAGRLDPVRALRTD